jgi:hypothetical protein
LARLKTHFGGGKPTVCLVTVSKIVAARKIGAFDEMRRHHGLRKHFDFDRYFDNKNIKI